MEILDAFEVSGLGIFDSCNRKLITLFLGSLDRSTRRAWEDESVAAHVLFSPNGSLILIIMGFSGY